MRYVLAAIVIWAMGLPAARALPMAGAKTVSASRTGNVVPVAKRHKPQSRQQAKGAGGIHPLVGSGGY